jgi:murein DD-endopeptidase MepM/ murein hydrolase activator NlpD
VAAASAAPAPAVRSTTKFRFVEGPKPVTQKAAAKPDARVASKPEAKAEPEKSRVRPGMVKTAKAEPAAPKAVPAPAAKPAPVQQAAAPAPAKAAPVQVAARVEPAPAKPAVQAAPAPAPQPEAKAPAASEPDQTGALGTDFRWPARGRVIAGFGANGGNEGINIAVPEGTPVKATEAGTVFYAGSEVKGYGNLVLIRHDNGFTSAYAHNGSLSVKRGERVKRGQVIATSGQTGNVTSPQLHFEIRKGQTPVDPLAHLSN